MVLVVTYLRVFLFLPALIIFIYYLCCRFVCWLEMNDKEKSLSNRSLVRRTMDEQDRLMNHFTRSIIDQPTAIDLFTHSIYQPTVLPNPSTVTNKGRKRLITEECPLEESNKRIRGESMKKIQSENQPPRATIKRRSLFLHHPKHDWNYFPIENQPLPLSSSSSSPFNPMSSSLSSASSFTPQSFNRQYSSSPSCDFHSIHYSPLFSSNESSMTMMKNNLRLYPTVTDVASPLRTTNFVLDGKQQNMNATIMRTGNISPAHSDTSIESTSTCSSDEAHFHSNFHSQPSRSFRERENYEQLLDLAEKLADPDRLEKINMEQFFSYRYKSTIATNDIFISKQTACVICMSPFKNGQRIRVLPCQHEYHSKCIARWFTMNSSCPICRRESLLSAR